MQRASAEPARSLHVGLPGGGPRKIAGDSDVTRDLLINGRDARKECLGEGGRGDLARNLQVGGEDGFPRVRIGRTAGLRRGGGGVGLAEHGVLRM
mgnify:CR=1 FL=1